MIYWYSTSTLQDWSY